eukprot:642209-Pelagomonas_calceolata.AAC.6
MEETVCLFSSACQTLLDILAEETIMLRGPGQARGGRQQGGGFRIESLLPGWRKRCPLSVGVIGRLFPQCMRPNGKCKSFFLLANVELCMGGAPNLVSDQIMEAPHATPQNWPGNSPILDGLV